MSSASTYASAIPCDEAERKEEHALSRSASHTAAPSVVHDDPTAVPEERRDVSTSLAQNTTSTTQGAASRNTIEKSSATADRSSELPIMMRSGNTTMNSVKSVPRQDVVFSPPTSLSAVGSALASSYATRGYGEAAANSTGTSSVRVHRVNHPHGFRILKDTSAIERSLKTYFRLPPAPNARLQQERQQLHRNLLRIEQNEARQLRRVAHGAGVLLDGFLLLSAAGVEDPNQVEAVTLQSSHLVGSVAEDLTYFQSLFFLDVSENELRLEDLLPLESLETVHLAYNRLSSLAGLEAYIQMEQQQQEGQWGGVANAGDDGGDGATLNPSEPGNTLGGTTTSKSSVLHGVLLPRLQALNLSYNTLRFTELPYLSYFPCLEKLDLSGNNLRRLPADLSLLASVTHLALENNGFTSDSENDVFLPLSSMPSLMEVNLNNNAISTIPVLSVQDGRGLCFPCIETIGLSENKFRRPDALLPLASLHRSLRRVVLSKNPLSTDTVLTKRTRSLFDQAVVDTFYERVLSTTAGRSAAAPLYTQAHDAAQYGSPSDAHAGDRASSAPGEYAGQSDEALWKGESWSRLILSAVGDGTGGNESAADVSSRASPGSADAGPLRTSAATVHSAMTASPPTLLTQGTESLSAEEYFYQHRVELVFDELKMLKQPLRYFYSTGLREGGHNTLVTIPDYKEFMDIYRITGRKKTSWKSKLPRPGVRNASTVVGRHRKQPVTVQAARSDEDEDEAVEDDDSPASTGSASTESSQRVPQDGAPVPRNDSTSEDVTFFMTEMEDEPVPHRPNKPVAPSQSAKTATAEGKANAGPAAERQRGRRVPNPSAPNLASKSAHVGPTTRPNRLPASVVSPATTNVHAAMSDLRAILRKPLPPLPYGANVGKLTNAPK